MTNEYRLTNLSNAEREYEAARLRYEGAKTRAARRRAGEAWVGEVEDESGWEEPGLVTGYLDEGTSDDLAAFFLGSEVSRG